MEAASSCSTATLRRAIVRMDRKKVALLGPGRNRSDRAARFVSECAGLRCIFLSHVRRSHIPELLDTSGHRGNSAEIGVWLGEFSKQLLHEWPHGGQHLLVDPYRSFACYRAFDKQCHFNQSVFEDVRARTQARMSMFGQRAVFVRALSAEAAANVPDASLAFAHVDARHDFDGVMQDLEAWWPKLQPDSVLAGHDWNFRPPGGAHIKPGERKLPVWPVALAVHAFLLGRSSFGCCGQPPEVFITSENPASWILPRGCCSSSCAEPVGRLRE